MSDPTVSAFLTKVLCKNGGRQHRDLLPVYRRLQAKKIKKILQDEPQKFSEVGKMVLARSPVRTCTKYLRGEAEEECDKLHLCRHYLRGECKRPWCTFSHDILSDQNQKILKANEISGLNEDEIKVLLLQNDNQLLPGVCWKYLQDSCDLGKDCSRLHICGFFTRGECNRRSCKFSHDLLEFGSDLLLTRCWMSEKTIENFQMICTVKHEERLQKVWAEKKIEQAKEKGQEQQERARSHNRKEESKKKKPRAQRGRGRPPNSKKEEETPGAQRGRPQNSCHDNDGEDLKTQMDKTKDCPPHESKDQLDLLFKMAKNVSLGQTMTPSRRQQPTPTACKSCLRHQRLHLLNQDS